MKLRKILVTIQIVCVLLMILITIDHQADGSYYELKLLTSRDCDFVVPPGWSIVKSTNNNRYAVKEAGVDDSFLYKPYFGGPETMYSSIAYPATFDDSCQAKQYLKHYIENNSPKFK